MQELQRISKRWNDLANDKERWVYVLEHKDELVIMLDNDSAHPCFHDSVLPHGLEDYSEDVPDLNEFDRWIGNSPGLDDLMEALGIQVEGV